MEHILSLIAEGLLILVIVLVAFNFWEDRHGL